MGKIFIPISLTALVVIYGYLQMAVPAVPVERPLEIRVEKGTSFKQAAAELQKHGLIQDVNLFIAIGRITGLHRKLIPGHYQFLGILSPWDVFKILRHGRIVQWEITVVEGDTLNDIKEKLKEIITEDDFGMLSSDREFLRSMNINAPSLEGYLFPDTYRIPKGMSPEEVLGIMVKRLREKYDTAMIERTRALGLDEKGVLTLASIIEKEVMLDRERPVISAVYHNRLKKGMPLQADPTTIYGIKPQRHGITRRDIRRRTEYNTYHISGLPPGPIASPGIKSIKAALYPANVPYLYFVSNGNGSHTFSVTLKEHIRAVKTYRAARISK